MEENQKRNSRTNKRKKQKRHLIITILQNMILLVIASILIYMAFGIYKEGSVKTKQEGKEESISEEEERVGNEDEQKKQVKIPSIPVPSEYKGYKVESRLEIPTIKLNTNVLEEYSKEGLDVCASKYYGPKANETGNYCIAAHNKKNMFNHLIDLKIGDSVYLTDNENGIIEYQVYDIYKVKPQNTEPLEQQTGGKKELTLITCVNYSQNRLVIKAIEKNQNI